MQIDISHIAKLANLPLTDDEKKKFETQLEETLTYVQELNEIDTNHVEPTAQVTGLENVTREDVVEPSLSQTEAVKNALQIQNGKFAVKGIFSDE